LKKLLIVATLCLCLSGAAFAAKPKYTPPYTRSGLPEVTISTPDKKKILNFISQDLANKGAFLAQESENVYTFESTPKSDPVILAITRALFETNLQNSLNNGMNKLRLVFNVLEAAPGSYRVIMRVFSIQSPGTPVERGYDMTSYKKNQKDYYDYLALLKNKVETVSIEKLPTPGMPTDLVSTPAKDAP
jgi:hypothetical protein